MNDKFFEDLREQIKPYFEDSGAHSFDHTERVYKNALKISEVEDVDLDIVKASALLHDVERLREKNEEIECHAEEGAKKAREILEKTDFPKEKIEKVCTAILSHRYSKRLATKTREAEILQDADRLDALGAICICRVLSYNGRIGKPLYDPKIKPNKIYTSNAATAINHFYEKILKIKPETFKTEKAREMAEERYSFVKEFVDKFLREWEGEE